MVVKGWPVRKSADWSADSKVLLTASVNTEEVPVVLSFDMEGNVKVLLQGDRNIPFDWVMPSRDGNMARSRCRPARATCGWWRTTEASPSEQKKRGRRWPRG